MSDSRSSNISDNRPRPSKKPFVPQQVITKNAKDDVSCLSFNTMQSLDPTISKNFGLNSIFRQKADEAENGPEEHNEIDDDTDYGGEDSLMRGLTRKAVDDVFDDALGYHSPERPSIFPVLTDEKALLRPVDSYFPDLSEDADSEQHSSLYDGRDPENHHRLRMIVAPLSPKRTRPPLAQTRCSFDAAEEERKVDEARIILASPLNTLTNTLTRVEKNVFYKNETSEGSAQFKTLDDDEVGDGHQSKRTCSRRFNIFVLTAGLMGCIGTIAAIFLLKKSNPMPVIDEEQLDPLWIPSASPSNWPTQFLSLPYTEGPSKTPIATATLSPTFRPMTPRPEAALPTITPTSIPTMQLRTLVPTSSPTSSPTTAGPTLLPSKTTAPPITLVSTASPTIELPFYEWIVFHSPVSVPSLNDPASPQSLAYAWLNGRRDLDTFGLLTLLFMTNTTGWNNIWDLTKIDKCSWYGISCDKNGDVTGIFLSFSGLNGRLPDEIALLTHLTGLSLAGSAESGKVKGNIVGTIPSSWGRRLTNLRTLELYDNQLTGSIPTTFSMMTQLGSLDLSGNGLSGPLRGHLGDLRSLRSLDLSFNNFVGNVPTELGHLTNLESLSLTSNALLGSLPVEYSRMAKLRELHLSNNNLDGSIVAVASMTDLEWIFLEDNQFTGNLAPTSLLSNLIGVQLQNNRMKGAIPSIWGSIGSLRILDLANNEFSGPIPETVQELHKLVYLSLDHNRLSGEIPEGICELPGLLRLSADCGTDVLCKCCTTCHF